MSARELWVLIGKLPQGSWTQTELRDADGERPPPDPDKFGPWSLEHYLLASLIDAVQNLTYVFSIAHSDPRKSAPKQPEPTRRPGVNERRRRRQRPAAIRYLDRLRARG